MNARHHLRLPWQHVVLAVTFLPLAFVIGCTHTPVRLAGELPASVTSPIAIHTVAPVYPYALQRTGFEGSAWVRCLVDETGRVRQPRIVESDDDAFATAALAALGQWEFAPATRNGRRIPMRVVIPFHFVLEPDEAGRR